MKLYHGSNMKVEVIDLAKSRPAKDFGRAFYLSAEEQQAKEMAQLKWKRSVVTWWLIALNLMILLLMG